jgi:hypothetical protein
MELVSQSVSQLVSVSQPFPRVNTLNVVSVFRV